MGVTHPALDGAKRMLDGFSALPHLLRMFVQPFLYILKNMFVLPAGDAALLARGTLILDRAVLTKAAPIAEVKATYIS